MKNQKKNKVCAIILMLLLFMSSIVYANQTLSVYQTVSVYMNNEKINFDVEPIIVNGRTMVPMRAIFEKLGAKVSWDSTTNTAKAYKGTKQITIVIGSLFMDTSSDQIQLDAPAMIVDGRTLIPLRAVSEAFNCEVQWDGRINRVNIYSDDDYSQEIAKQTMYAPDGLTIVVDQSEVEAYKNTGWYTEPVVLMYASDGRTLYVVQSEVEEYKNVGWYTEPVVLMYAADGRTLYVIQSEVESYKNVGWYTEQVETLYALDGRTRNVLKSEVEAYKKVGWYDLESFILLSADKHVKEYGYDTAIATLENYVERWEDEYIEDESIRNSITIKILELIDEWYKSTGKPIVVTDWYRSENSIGTPEINITFRNISPKTITALETRFTCYDAYGNVTTDYPSLYDGSITGSADNEKIYRGERVTLTWTLYSNERTKSISWPYVVRCAFSDGTSWYN